MAAVILVSVITVTGFLIACLALRQVRPTWFRMQASVRWLASFSVEMDGRARSDIGRTGSRIPRAEQVELRGKAHRDGDRIPRS